MFVCFDSKPAIFFALHFMISVFINRFVTFVQFYSIERGGETHGRDLLSLNSVYCLQRMTKFSKFIIEKYVNNNIFSKLKRNFNKKAAKKCFRYLLAPSFQCILFVGVNNLYLSINHLLFLKFYNNYFINYD